ncbi:MAG TPA: penicillin-binding protein 2 [Opitutaceae bacterium]|nr:penicillin-binding protein 2 [Opitutaceae bacterium]
MSRGFASSYRIALVVAAVLASFAGVGARLVSLHVLQREKFLSYIEKARDEIIIQNARRGDILDAHGSLLATSRSLIVLGADPQALRKEDEAKWPALARLLGLRAADLEKKFAEKIRPAAEAAGDDNGAPETDAADDGHEVRWVKLCDAVDESTYDQIKALNIRGIYGNRIFARVYPQNQLAAHVLGYVNGEGEPVMGLERYLDFYLRGQNGWLETERDGLRRELAQFRSRDVAPADGYDAVLSLDATVQNMVEQELQRLADKYHPAKATIIVGDLRPDHAGFLLALGNWPSFNPNDYSRAGLAAQRNIAITDQFEPGSTFKIVAASAALNENLVTPASRFDCTIESVEYEGTLRHLPREDASDHFDHPLSVAEIIAKSSNKGAAQLAMRLGDQKFYDYVRAFGFGQSTGFPAGGEIDGELAPPARWDGLTITRMPMGQSVGVTAMQMHCAMGVIASGGYLLRPQVVKEIRDTDGSVIYRFRPVVKRRVLSESTARTMARLLEGVAMTDGSGNAPEAAIPGFEVAGKTGTAQKLLPVVDAKGHTVLRYSDRHHIASFVGFFPASNPQVAITVIVDDADACVPGGVAYGHIVAAPVFKRLGEQLIPYLNLQPPAEPARPQFAMEGGPR